MLLQIARLVDWTVVEVQSRSGDSPKRDRHRALEGKRGMAGSQCEGMVDEDKYWTTAK